jgi:hypothetical protein
MESLFSGVGVSSPNGRERNVSTALSGGFPPFSRFFIKFSDFLKE